MQIGQKVRVLVEVDYLNTKNRVGWIYQRDGSRYWIRFTDPATTTAPGMFVVLSPGDFEIII